MEGFLEEETEGWRKCSWVVSKALNLSAASSVSLQSLLAQHKDFGAAFEPLQRKLSDLQVRVQAENGLQPDLPGKQAQLSRLQVRSRWGPCHFCSRAQLHLEAAPLPSSTWPVTDVSS